MPSCMNFNDYIELIMLTLDILSFYLLKSRNKEYSNSKDYSLQSRQQLVEKRTETVKNTF